MLLDQLERLVLADRQLTAMAMTAGAKDLELPDLAKEREKFDAMLVEEPKVLTVVDSEQWELHRAMGVA